MPHSFAVLFAEGQDISQVGSDALVRPAESKRGVPLRPRDPVSLGKGTSLLAP
jgi:hypothetical protein